MCRRRQVERLATTAATFRKYSSQLGRPGGLGRWALSRRAPGLERRLATFVTSPDRPLALILENLPVTLTAKH
jgi:hypothetical protein